MSNRGCLQNFPWCLLLLPPEQKERDAFKYGVFNAGDELHTNDPSPQVLRGGSLANQITPQCEGGTRGGRGVKRSR